MSYRTDVGCAIATVYLKEQSGDKTIRSQCTECPFPRCLEEKTDRHRTGIIETRIVEVRRLVENGIGTGAIAQELGIRPRLVRYYKTLIKRGEVT